MSSQCLSNSNRTEEKSFTPGYKKEMTDKTTQAIISCEKCALIWSILDRRKRKEIDAEGPQINR